MPDTLYPPSRPQSVGEILDAAFRIYSATLVKCLPYSFSSVILGQLLSVYDIVHRHGTTAAAIQAANLQKVLDPRWWLLVLVLVVASVMFANAVFLRQYALVTGGASSMRAELARSLRRVPGIVLIGVLIGLTIIATLIPVGFAMGLIVASMSIGRPGPMLASPAGMAIGMFVAALVAGSWVLIRWVCSGPIYLLTDRGPVASMSHSWQLTSGNFWRLSVIYAVGAILLLVFYALASIAGGMMALLVGRGDIILFMGVTSAVTGLLAALFTPFYHSLILAVYGDLSVRREGADLAQRISVPAVQ